MTYLKHKDGKGPRKSKSSKQAAAAPVPLEVNVEVPGLWYVEAAITELASAVKSYAYNASIGENKLAVFTGEEGSGQYPVLIALDPGSETTQDALAVAGRIATAFERIADALTNKEAAAGGGAES